MKIFVAGAKGLLGSSLCPHLKYCGHNVLRQSRSNSEIKVDPTDFFNLELVLNTTQPDVIINLIALSNVDACEKDPPAAYRVNTLVVENMARWLLKKKNKTHLVQISTDHVYDGAGPHREENVLLSNYYAFSKYAGELAALSSHATVIRTNFFGISQCPGRETLSDWLVSALRSKAQITIFDDVWFSPLEITTLSKHIEHAARLKIPGVFNLGSKNGLTKADFAEKLAEATGLSTANTCRRSVADAHLNTYRPKDMRMDVRRFEAAFKVELPNLSQEIEKAGRKYRNEI